MGLAREKFGKKLAFLPLILGLMAGLAIFTAPSNLAVIIIMNILITLFFFLVLKLFFTGRIAFVISLPIFFLLLLLTLNLLDPLNVILVISLSIAVGLLLK